MAVLERFFTVSVFAALLICLLSVGRKNQNAVEQLKRLRSQAETRMSPRIVEEPGFTVAGIAVRTSNAKEMSPDGIIGKQWARLMQENLLAKIPNKADASIVAVYSDHASDKDGDYTYLLGARVTSDAGVPSGMITKKIQGGKFAVFTTEKGPGPKVVPETWRRINSLPKSSVGGDRLYRADFEVYDQRAADPQNLQADVYVGIR
jgi:predicted transcriptional regulator YdeE